MAKFDLSSEGRKASEILRRLVVREKRPKGFFRKEPTGTAVMKRPPQLDGNGFAKESTKRPSPERDPEHDPEERLMTRQVTAPYKEIGVNNANTTISSFDSLSKMRPESGPIAISQAVPESERLPVFLDGLCDRTGVRGVMVVDAVGRSICTARISADDQSLASVGGMMGQVLRRISQILSIPSHICRISLHDERYLLALNITVEGRVYTLLADSDQIADLSSHLLRHADQLREEVEIYTRTPR